MANDEKNISVHLGRGLTRSLAEEISVRLCDGDMDKNRRQNVVVVPHVAGIVFASLDPAAASTAARHGRRASGSGSSSRSNASVRATVVLARLEQEKGRDARSTTVPRHRFVLEDLEMFCDDDSGEGNRTKGRNGKRRNARRRTTRVSMPVTYAALLEEAISPLPGPGEPVMFISTLGTDGVICTTLNSLPSVRVLLILRFLSRTTYFYSY